MKLVLIFFMAGYLSTGHSFELKNLFKSKSETENQQLKAILDNEFKGLSPEVVEQLEKAREIASKHCYFSVFRTFTTALKPGNLRMMRANLGYGLVCIENLVANKDTINERSGCTAVAFDALNGHYVNFDQARVGYPKAVSKKPCEDGGFEDLMQMKGTWNADILASYKKDGATVMEAITSNRMASYYGSTGKKILIYAKRLKDAQFFLAENSKADKAQQEKDRKYAEEKAKESAKYKEQRRKEEINENIERSKQNEKIKKNMSLYE